MRRFSKTKVANEPGAKAGLLPASALRNVPNEVLQRVFFFAVVNQVGSCNRPQLLAICRVSRRWYNSAVKHCPLWTTLPPIHLDDKADLRTTRRILNSTTVYLARSGILPISFQLTIEDGPSDDSPAYRKTVSTVTSLIVSQCHRWAQASLKLSAISILDLMPIKGRLPLLTNLKLSSPPFRTLLARPDTRVALSDPFRDAPQLRHLAIDTPSSFHDMFGDMTGGMSCTSPPFVFQWTQLENIYAQGEDHGLYSTLMDAQPTVLRSLELRARVLRQLPRTTLFLLPHLVKLAFRLSSGIECDLLGHLGALRLPALTHLELWGRLRDTTVEAYSAVEGLVGRSNCSLRLLYLCVSSVNGAVGSFSNLLSLSPELETLHTTVPRDDILRTLIHDPAAPIPLLPKLRTLGLHAWYSTTTAIVRLHLGALIHVIQSRTSAPADREGRVGGSLQETIFVYTSDQDIHRAVFVDDFISQFDRGFDSALDRTTRGILASFGRNLTEEGFSFWRNDQKSFHPRVLARMEAVIRSVEGLRIENNAIQAVMRYGLPRILHDIGQRPDNSIPGDLVPRARKLVEKWKSYILRDARAGEFRWCGHGRGIVSLEYNRGAEGYTTDDEGLWNAILGVGDECSAYHSLKKWASFSESFT